MKVIIELARYWLVLELTKWMDAIVFYWSKASVHHDKKRVCGSNVRWVLFAGPGFVLSVSERGYLFSLENISVDRDRTDMNVSYNSLASEEVGDPSCLLGSFCIKIAIKQQTKYARRCKFITWSVNKLSFMLIYNLIQCTAAHDRLCFWKMIILKNMKN